MIPLLTLAVWKRSPDGRRDIAGELTWTPSSFEEFSTTAFAMIAAIASPDTPAFATCDRGTFGCGGDGITASIQHEQDIEWAIRYLWRNSVPIAALVGTA